MLQANFLAFWPSFTLENSVTFILCGYGTDFRIATVLGWQNGRESFEDISVTVDAIDVSMDVGVVYRGLDEGSKHQLISVVSSWSIKVWNTYVPWSFLQMDVHLPKWLSVLLPYNSYVSCLGRCAIMGSTTIVSLTIRSLLDGLCLMTAQLRYPFFFYTHPPFQDLFERGIWEAP